MNDKDFRYYLDCKARLAEVKSEIQTLEDSLWEHECEQDDLRATIQKIKDNNPEIEQMELADQQARRAAKRAERRLAIANGGKFPESLKGLQWWKAPVYPNAENEPIELFKVG